MKTRNDLSRTRQKNVKQSNGSGYYRSGQAADELGISAYHVRRLCDAGLIDAVIGPGGHWRIPVEEVGRLKEQGVPAIPAGIAEIHSSEDEQISEHAASSAGDRLAPPSADVVRSAERVELASNELKLRKLQRGLVQEDDFFRDRAATEARAEAEELRKQAAADAVRRREQWQDLWIQWALSRIPKEIPHEYRLDVRQQVLELLKTLSETASEPLTQQLVEASKEEGLKRWRFHQDSEKAITEAVETLPCFAKSSFSPTQWQVRARHQASQAIARLAPDSTFGCKKAAATAAVQPIRAEYEEQELRSKIANEWIFLPDLSWVETEEAKNAVKAKINTLPIGSSESEIRKARESVLKRIEAAAGAKRKKQEFEQQVERQLSHISTYLEEEFEFKDRWDLLQTAERLKPKVRKQVLQQLSDVAEEEQPTTELIRSEIEAAVELLFD